MVVSIQTDRPRIRETGHEWICTRTLESTRAKTAPEPHRLARPHSVVLGLHNLHIRRQGDLGRLRPGVAVAGVLRTWANGSGKVPRKPQPRRPQFPLCPASMRSSGPCRRKCALCFPMATDFTRITRPGYTDVQFKANGASPYMLTTMLVGRWRGVCHLAPMQLRSCALSGPEALLTRSRAGHIFLFASAATARFTWSTKRAMALPSLRRKRRQGGQTHGGTAASKIASIQSLHRGSSPQPTPCVVSALNPMCPLQPLLRHAQEPESTSARVLCGRRENVLWASPMCGPWQS